MIVEAIVIAVLTIVTTIFTKVALKACHIESKCSECCDIVLETEAEQNEG